jgi:hypothetical protein
MPNEDNVFYFDNDRDIQKDIQTPGPTGEYIAATGLTGINVFIAAEKGDAAIAGLETFPMTERPQMPGRYYVTVPGATITAELAPFEDVGVWVCLELPGNLRLWEFYMVRSERQ